MNLILTTSCNKGCSFCFAKDVLDKDEMSLDSVKELISKTNSTNVIKLLGGEPTQSTIFCEILDYLSTIKNEVVLISNFLFDDNISNAINRYTENKKIFSLINVSEISQSMFDKTSDNIISVYKKNSFEFSLGYTINLNKNFNYYKQYLDKYKDKLNDKFKGARISLPYPNPEEKYTSMYFYEKYEYTDMIEEFIKWGQNNNVKFNLDCGLYPCMMRDIEQEKFFESWLNDFKFGCESGTPADVLNKSEIQYCYPGRDVRVNLEKHPNIQTAYNELLLRKNMAYLTKKLPNECKNCEYLNKKCPGPCLGFLS